MKLDEDIEILIQQERALYFINSNHELTQIEHHELVGKLTKLQAERAEWIAELAKQDNRIARTLEGISGTNTKKRVEF